MSEEQLPQETPQTDPTNSATPFPPQNGGFPPNKGGFFPNDGGFGGMQQQLPNATAVLILGILSIVTCCCYGVIGTVLAIVALILSKKDRILYAANMSLYTESSFKNLNAGRVCAIIGLILSALVVLFYIALIVAFGWATITDQEALKQALQDMQH